MIIFCGCILTYLCFSFTGGATEETYLHMLRGRAKHCVFQMDTGKPPAFFAFFFKRPKTEEHTQGWQNNFTSHRLLLIPWSNQRDLFCFLPPREIEKEKNKQEFLISWQLFLLFSSCNISPFTSGIFSHCLPPPPNSQPSDWNTERKYTCDLSLLLPWQPVLPLKFSSLQPWRPAMTFDLLPPASSDLLTA